MRLRVRRVRELAELRREQERDLLADVDGVIADPLERTGHEHHAEAVLAHALRATELENAASPKRPAPASESIRPFSSAVEAPQSGERLWFKDARAVPAAADDTSMERVLCIRLRVLLLI